jgi:hypothetical protein
MNHCATSLQFQCQQAEKATLTNYNRRSPKRRTAWLYAKPTLVAFSSFYVADRNVTWNAPSRLLVSSTGRNQIQQLLTSADTGLSYSMAVCNTGISFNSHCTTDKKWFQNSFRVYASTSWKILFVDRQNNEITPAYTKLTFTPKSCERLSSN